MLDRVLARPALTAALAVCALVVLALPVLRLHTATPGASDLPQQTAALQTYNRIQQVFPGGGSPAVVVVEAPDVTAPAVAAAGQAFERAALASGQMNEPITLSSTPPRTAALSRYRWPAPGRTRRRSAPSPRCGTRSSRTRWAGCPASGSR